jgi:N-methylhydantoinase B/oxoprolinase/acetone carboxylase alpha subunit
MVNKEFIAAKDLPVNDAAEVNVLCVENGELKQKPASNLGGSGGGYVIHIPLEDIKTQTDSLVAIELTQSRDDFAELLYNGGSVWLDMSALGVQGAVVVTMYGWEDGVLNLMTMIFFGNLMMIQVTCPNGTWTPPEV